MEDRKKKCGKENGKGEIWTEGRWQGYRMGGRRRERTKNGRIKRRGRIKGWIVRLWEDERNQGWKDEGRKNLG